MIGLLWSPKFITTAYHVNTCIYFTYTQNHTIERIWLEVNRRVNYPLKAVLVEMADHGQLVLDDPVHQYCMSWISIQVANVGVSLCLLCILSLAVCQLGIVYICRQWRPNVD